MDDGNVEDIEGSDNRPRDGVVRDGKLDDVGGINPYRIPSIQVDRGRSKERSVVDEKESGGGRRR